MSPLAAAVLRSQQQQQQLWLSLIILSFLMIHNDVYAKNLDLRPYTDEHGHGPRRSHLEQRDIVGEKLYEVFLANDSLPLPHPKELPCKSELPSGSEYISTRRLVGGRFMSYFAHVSYASNPVHTMSIYEPPGGCNDVDHRTPVSITSRNHQCIIAGNAGFFNTSTGSCLGNLVSDGHVVQAPGTMNANFGIRRDGAFVVGYLSEDDILPPNHSGGDDNSTTTPLSPFLQLVAGVIWLVRDGKEYVEQSSKFEDMSTQDTGGGFVGIQSARAALGHDKYGRVVLFQVDGESYVRGLSLKDMARILIEDFDIVNAINLDGGGSMTSVINGTVTGYPSDKQSEDDHLFRCARPVTTIVCLHDPLCNAAACGPHGSCVDGKCVCVLGWMGVDCLTASPKARKGFPMIYIIVLSIFLSFSVCLNIIALYCYFHQGSGQSFKEQYARNEQDSGISQFEEAASWSDSDDDNINLLLTEAKT